METRTASFLRIQKFHFLQAAYCWFENAQYVSILLVLFAVGYVGHITHWSFGIAKETHTSQKITVADSILTSPSKPDGWKVQFQSEKSLNRSGVKTAPIEQRTVCERVKATGVITYDERTSAFLSARVSGTVWKVVKNVGDPVRRGEVLVIVDAAEVGRAKAEFLKELVAVESKREVLQSYESLPGIISGRQVREARVAFREASIRLQNVEQDLVNLGMNIHKEAFEILSDAERVTKLHFFGLPDSIASLLDRDQTTSNLLALSASFDGVVVRQDAALGEMVESGKPIVEIADMRKMWLKLDVPKEDAAKLTLGQNVRFIPDGIDRELDSKISWISTEMNQRTRTLQVRAEVENPIVASIESTGHEVRMLRANTFGTGVITLDQREFAYMVPASALLHADNEPMVFLRVNDLSFAGVNVKVGVRDRQMIQIEADELKPGIEVVTQGSHVLKSEWMLNHVASVIP